MGQVESYSFDQIAHDWDLDHFDHDVIHDQEAMIPLIKKAMDASGGKLKLFGSPWSPPAWMKAPVDGEQSMVGSHEPNGLLEYEAAHESWAK